MEILHVEGLPPLKPGQTRSLRPSVEVTFQAQAVRSPMANVRKNTAAFGWKSVFAAGIGDPRISIRVYNQIGRLPSAKDALVGADWLIGETELPLLATVPPEGLLFTCTLRKENRSTGRVAIHYEMAARHPVLGGRHPPAGSFLVGNAFGETVCTAESLSPCQALSSARCSTAGPGATVAAPASTNIPELQLGSLTSVAAGPTLLAGMMHRQAGSSCRSSSTDSSSSDNSKRVSEDGFESAVEEMDSPTSKERLPSDAQGLQISERVAERYIRARMQNDIFSLQQILARDAVITVPRPLGGSTQHSGWDEIEAYLKSNRASPNSFREWTHVSTEDSTGPDGASKATVVRWVGKLYKYGLWQQVHCDFLIDSGYLVRRVSIAKGS